MVVLLIAMDMFCFIIGLIFKLKFSSIKLNTQTKYRNLETGRLVEYGFLCTFK